MINSPNKYLKFKLEIATRRCWTIDEKGKEEEIVNKFSDKWGSLGFRIWLAEDWEKSGKTTFINFHIRRGANWNVMSDLRGRALPEEILEVFNKYYNPKTGKFLYWKKYYNIGSRPNYHEIRWIEFTDEDLVEKDRTTGHWSFIKKNNKGLKEVWQELQKKK